MNRYFIILFCFLLLAGCGQVNLALHGDYWQGHESFPVQGRTGLLINQKLAFGDFHTTDVNRSWTKGTNSYAGFGIGSPVTGEYLNIIGREYIDRKQTIRFDLSDGGQQASSVFCVSRFQADDLIIGNDQGPISFGIDLLELKKGNSSSIYFAQIYSGNSSEPWQLMLDNDRVQRKPKNYGGVVTGNNGEYYTIFPVTSILSKNGKAMEMPFGSIGLEIRDRTGQPLAAVNLADKGQVHFIQGLGEKERFMMANICAALLLQEVIG